MVDLDVENQIKENQNDFTITIVNKKGCQNRLKVEKGPFWCKFEIFDSEINIVHK